MINFARILGLSSEQTASGTLEQKLGSALAAFDDSKVQYLTGLAGLLGRVAFCDTEVAPDEVAAIQAILETKGHLNAQEADAVAKILADVATDLAGIEDYRYTRLINESLPETTKRKEFLTLLFEVAASHEFISAKEDHTIGEIAHDLKLTRKDFIEIRLRFKEQLTLFQNDPSVSDT